MVISFHHKILNFFLFLLILYVVFLFIIISFLFLRPRRCGRNRLFELPRRKHSPHRQRRACSGCNGGKYQWFCLQTEEKEAETIQWQRKTVAGGSLGSFAKSQVDTTKNIKNLPPMSNNLPTYPDTAYPASVRGPTFDNIKGSVFEKDAHRLINLFNNAVNKEMESINKVFPADGPYGVFNFLATTVSSDFLARAKTILLASAKQQEIRVKSNAPYVRPLPMNTNYVLGKPC